MSISENFWTRRKSLSALSSLPICSSKPKLSIMSLALEENPLMYATRLAAMLLGSPLSFSKVKRLVL